MGGGWGLGLVGVGTTTLRRLHPAILLVSLLALCSEASFGGGGGGRLLGGGAGGGAVGRMDHQDLFLKSLRAEREERMRAAGILAGPPPAAKREDDAAPATPPRGKSHTGGGGAAVMTPKTVDLTLSDDDTSPTGQASRGTGPAGGGGGGQDWSRWDDESDEDYDDHETADRDLALRLQQDDWGYVDDCGAGAGASPWGAAGGTPGAPGLWASPNKGGGGSSLLGGQALSSQDLTGDVCPDAHQMFLYYDELYFKQALSDKAVYVEWSKKMVKCAGTCTYR